MIESGNKKKLRISIIGAGRLGTAIGYAISEKNNDGIKIVSVASPSKESIKRAKDIFGKKSRNIFFTKNNSQAASKANAIFICTPDDIIKKVCDELYRVKNDEKKIIIHFSGSKSLKVLKTAQKNGDHIASIHPLKSFASITESVKTLEGIEYGITYIDSEGEIITNKIVKLLKGNVIFIKDEVKPVYHAAACIASNYLVTLIDYAVFINKSIGIEPGASTRGLLNLINGTVKNIKKMGTGNSLTGPIARGDISTIKDHLKVLKSILDEKDIELYRIMGKKTADLARKNSWIDNNTHSEIIKLLDGGNVVEEK